MGKEGEKVIGLVAQPDTWEYALGYVVMDYLREGYTVQIRAEKPIPKRRHKKIGDQDIIDLGSRHI